MCGAEFWENKTAVSHVGYRSLLFCLPQCLRSGTRLRDNQECGILNQELSCGVIVNQECRIKKSAGAGVTIHHTSRRRHFSLFSFHSSLPEGIPFTSPMQCGAMPDAAHCDGRCSALREPLHRTAFPGPIGSGVARGVPPGERHTAARLPWRSSFSPSGRYLSYRPCPSHRRVRCRSGWR